MVERARRPFVDRAGTAEPIRDFDQGAVQPGAAMTVEEMRPVRRAPPPALFILFGLHVCEKRGGKKQRAALARAEDPDTAAARGEVIRLPCRAERRKCWWRMSATAAVSDQRRGRSQQLLRPRKRRLSNSAMDTLKAF